MVKTFKFRPLEDSGRFFIGIDVGMTGAVSVINAKGELMSCCRMPVCKYGKRTEINITDFSRLFKIKGKVMSVIVEEVYAFGMGRTSAFSFGKNQGMILGVVQTLRLPTKRITPQEWQKVMLAGLPRKDKTKESANKKAIYLFPELEDILDVKANQGIADASLMAEYGRLMYSRGSRGFLK
tara:strand:- start:3242 stop:3784 length:543 start_codon:yes stop_codon:yes gene_type:complete